MPDPLHWLGVTKIHRFISMSDMKYNAIVSTVRGGDSRGPWDRDERAGRERERGGGGEGERNVYIYIYIRRIYIYAERKRLTKQRRGDNRQTDREEMNPFDMV